MQTDSEWTALNLRFTRQQHDALVEHARREERSLSAEIRWRLQQSLEEPARDFRDAP